MLQGWSASILSPEKSNNHGVEAVKPAACPNLTVIKGGTLILVPRFDVKMI